jgi:ribonuclease HI
MQNFLSNEQEDKPPESGGLVAITPVHLYVKGHSAGEIGSWAFVLNLPNTDTHKSNSASVKLTTANAMEIEACIKGFETLTRPCLVSVFTNNTYLQGGITLLLNGSHYDTNILKWVRLLDAMEAHTVSVTHIPKAQNSGYMRLADSIAFNLLPPMGEALMDAATFLAQFYRYANEGYIGVTYLAPEGVRVPYGRAITNFAAMPLRDDLDLSHIHEMNALGYSVYFRVMVQSTRHEPMLLKSPSPHEAYVHYPRGGANESVFTRVLWGEVDFKDASPDDALAAVNGLQYPPSIVVRSGGGFHLYWLLNEIVCINGAVYTGGKGRSLSVEADALKRTLKGIAKAIGCADSSVADIARVMRLPDTINTKPERNGARCEIVSKVARATYDYRDLELTYAPLVTPVPPRVERNLAPANHEHLPRWLADYLNHGALEGGRNKMLYAAAREYHDLGKSEMEASRDCGGRARSDGLEDSEIEATIHKAYGAPVSVKNPVVALRDRMLKGMKK